jgi:hypothetical protein
MDAVFQKMNNVKRYVSNMRTRRNASKEEYKAKILEKCDHIRPGHPYPEQYIHSCHMFPEAKRVVCEEYAECAKEATKDLNLLNFNNTDIVPDFKFPLYPGQNIDVRYNVLSNFNSTDVLRTLRQILDNWPWPLDQTTMILMLGAGNSVRQNLLIGRDEVLNVRPHVLIFNIDPKFIFGGNIAAVLKPYKLGRKGTGIIVSALENNKHMLWTAMRKRLGAVAPPVITELSDKIKTYEFTRPGGRTLTYVYVKSFANEHLTHSFFWPKGHNGVYKVYLDYLKTGGSTHFKRFLLDIYDDIQTIYGSVKNNPHIVWNNSFDLLVRGIEGGKRRRQTRRLSK